ncbi:MAG: hypothetical protein ABS46_16740 [Cytophagaceae bacterium SCN 52-12]|nr:MAG: hypothetical protein ABS46_16740 [Cytophagaceae bacterium SCN 52-12]
MKKSYNILAGLAAFSIMAGASATAQSALKDSVIISFNEQTKMVIYGTDRKEIEKLSRYDFNRLIKDVLSRLDSVSPAGGVSKDWVDGEIYLKKDSARKEGKGNRAPERESGGESRLGHKEGEEKAVVKVVQTGEGENGSTENVTDTVYIRHPRKYIRRSPRQGIDFRLGLNTYGEKKPNGYSPDEFDLRPGGSRYISLGIIRSFPVVKGRKSSFFMDLGIDASWYNLMFEGNEVIRKEESGVIFTRLTDHDGNEISLKKSKLVAPYVNLSMMPTYTFAGSVISHVSAGMYAGYRVGGYHKSKAHGGDKERVSGDFHMQDLRYGLALELGVRSFPDLFVNYDINNLFEVAKGPQVRMLSFGLKM